MFPGGAGEQIGGRLDGISQAGNTCPGKDLPLN